MDTHQIEVEKRDSRGKGEARKMRAAGRVPGVLYGHKEAPVALSLDPVRLRRQIEHSGKRRNTLFQLTGLDREVLALPKDIQIDPVSRVVLHVDFQEVRDGERVIVEVPISYSGRPEGVVRGGKLEGTRRTVKLDCSPLAIPLEIPLNIQPLQIGDTVRVSDLALPEGVIPAVDPKLTVATVKAPRGQKKDDEEGGED